MYYSDDQTADLSDIPPEEYLLEVQPSDTEAVAVVKKPDQKFEIIALKSNPVASISAELRSTENCADTEMPPLAVNKTIVYVRLTEFELDGDELRKGIPPVQT